LPSGTTEISTELKIPDGAHDLSVVGGGRTVLRASAAFRGRAIVSCRGCRKLKLYNFAIDGNRAVLAKPQPMAKADKTFAESFDNNGVLVEDGSGVELDHVDFRNIASFAVLVNHSRDVLLDHLSVHDSGSLNALKRNNTTGGVLLEEGTDSFTVADSTFENIEGNAIWTHSRYGSARNRGGKIRNNQFSEIGRDAIQVGHAVDVEVSGNRGRRIGFPNEIVDLENQGTPVGIDTAGNVENATYQHNTFEEINGKCIDLDGFHDSVVRGNTCINRGKPDDYPFGHFGIVFNNANIDMHSQNVLVEENELNGMKFGGIFLIGTGHRILRNRLLRINIAHCNENRAQFGCSALGEPEVLETGIYLGSHAEHPAPATGNRIEGNTISGWKMKSRCIQAAPGVQLKSNTIQRNTCADE
jgi:Right handed beta helix region